MILQFYFFSIKLFFYYLCVLEKKIRPLRISEVNELKNVPDPMPLARSLFLFSPNNQYAFCFIPGLIIYLVY